MADPSRRTSARARNSSRTPYQEQLHRQLVASNNLTLDPTPPAHPAVSRVTSGVRNGAIHRLSPPRLNTPPSNERAHSAPLSGLDSQGIATKTARKGMEQSRSRDVAETTRTLNARQKRLRKLLMQQQEVVRPLVQSQRSALANGITAAANSSQGDLLLSPTSGRKSAAVQPAAKAPELGSRPTSSLLLSRGRGTRVDSAARNNRSQVSSNIAPPVLMSGRPMSRTTHRPPQAESHLSSFQPPNAAVQAADSESGHSRTSTEPSNVVSNTKNMPYQPASVSDSQSHTANDIVIKVHDDNRKVNQDFTCPRDVLVSEMSYFSQYIGDDDSEPDISVHCDVHVFEWLMKYVKARAGTEHVMPRLSQKNVVSILISSSFLRMKDLIEDCLDYIHENVAKVIAGPASLKTVRPSLLKRLAAKFSPLEILKIRDKRDRLTSKLAWYKLEEMCGHEPYTSLFKCKDCHAVVQSGPALPCMACVPTRASVDHAGRLLYQHEIDCGWTLAQYLLELNDAGADARSLLAWTIGSVTLFVCSTCNMLFSAAQHNKCAYHPAAPVFDKEHPTGFYPCCGRPAVRTSSATGRCATRSHTPKCLLDSVSIGTAQVSPNTLLAARPSQQPNCYLCGPHAPSVNMLRTACEACTKQQLDLLVVNMLAIPAQEQAMHPRHEDSMQQFVDVFNADAAETELIPLQPEHPKNPAKGKDAHSKKQSRSRRGSQASLGRRGSLDQHGNVASSVDGLANKAVQDLVLNRLVRFQQGLVASQDSHAFQTVAKQKARKRNVDLQREYDRERLLAMARELLIPAHGHETAHNPAPTTSDEHAQGTSSTDASEAPGPPNSIFSKMCSRYEEAMAASEGSKGSTGSSIKRGMHDMTGSGRLTVWR